MKKKVWIPVVVIVVLIAILFVPIMSIIREFDGRRENTDSGQNSNIVTTNSGQDTNEVNSNGDSDDEVDVHSFIATVLEVNGDYIVVEPLEGELELRSSDKISFNISDTDVDIKIGDIVNVKYTGYIMETYPAQINVTGLELCKDTRNIEYTEEWIDKENAEKNEKAYNQDLVITEIYKNCFFAQYVIPVPYEFKINGNISEDWCEGDKVLVTYNNQYISEENKRIEGDLQNIEISNFEVNDMVCYKPVIYLYPEQETDVLVNLDLSGKLTCTYPSYDNGWEVTAFPDGTLKDADGQIYNYLYWEGDVDPYAEWDMRRGFCIKGEDTAAFLEDSLANLGLTRKEANEFIVYWLPLMQENEYNVISFQTDIYTEAAKLNVTPAPDTLIRVFMTYRPSDEYIEMKEQELFAPERTGFTVVEWGGTEVN